MTDVHVPDQPAPAPVVVQTGGDGGAVVAQALDRVEEEGPEAQAAAALSAGAVVEHAQADAAEHGALYDELQRVKARQDALDARWADWEPHWTRKVPEGAMPAEAEAPVAEVAQESSGAVEVAVAPTPTPEAVAETATKQERKRGTGLWLTHPMRSRRNG